MAQAKHIGKLMVDMQDRQGSQDRARAASVAIDPDASYLIIRRPWRFGIGGCRRLARHGARRLALARPRRSRRPVPRLPWRACGRTGSR